MQTTLSAEQLLDQNKPLQVKIDQQKAFNHLYQVAKAPAADNALQQADWLDALRYCTTKKKIQTALTSSDGKKWASTDEAVSDKKFTIKVALKGTVTATGNLILPAKTDWLKLCQQIKLNEKKGSDCQSFDWASLEREFFKAGSKRPHHKTRQEFSLPVIESPSGGFRVHRKATNEQPVWQLMAINSTAASGFVVTNGLIDWKKTALLPALYHSDNLVPLGLRYEPYPAKILPFDLWLPIEIKQDHRFSVEMAAGTKDRRYIKITQPLQDFLSWTNCNEIDSLWQSKSEIKTDGKAFATQHGYSLLGTPRSNLFITRLGKLVTYWYIVASSSAEMNQAYQAAYTQWLNNKDS